MSNQYTIGENEQIQPEFQKRIDDCDLHKYENVLHYKYKSCQSILTIQISPIDENIQNQKEIYYIFDCPGEDALLHWLVECFIFYPIFLKLKLEYPTIKILTKNTKRYVRNLFNFVNINDEIKYNIESPNNICFFSPIISLNDLHKNRELFVKYVKLYIDDVNIRLSTTVLENNKILLLPRNSKDNYKANERIIPGIQLLEDKIIDMGGVVLNTYDINNISLQFAIIKHSDIIIMDYGSSFFFNTLFVKNKTIIVLDNYRYSSDQINNFYSMKHLYELINEKNKVIIVTTTDCISNCGVF